MKLPIEERTAFADQVLSLCWGCEYWSREEQMFACAEGWSLTVFGTDKEEDRISRWDFGHGSYTDFDTDKEAVAYVLKRAEEGSPLHCRALILHAASVLKHGE